MSSLKKYEYVIAIANSGGISQAAEALNIAQPTLSKYIKKLEAELGTELFDRSTNPIRLTDAGNLFIRTGRYMLDLDKQFKKELEEIKQNKNTVIRVGISPSRSPYMMPAIIEAYRNKNPFARIVIEEKTTGELSRSLSNGDLDLVINLLDKENENFERIELFEENIFLAVAKKLYKDTDSVTNILHSCPLINVGKGLSMWQTMNEIVEDSGARTPEIECQSIESALSLVKRGLGAMIVPSYIAKFGTEEQNKNIIFLNLSKEEFPSLSTHKRTVCLFYRKEQFLTQSEKDFISCVK